MKHLLSLVCAVLLLTACSKDDDAPAFERTKATRAIMIYMSGENNLTSHAGIRYLNDDLSEMIEGSKLLSDNQRVFVFVDSLGTNSNNKGTPYIIEVHGGKTYNRKRFDTDFYSCDPDKFKEIVSWMTTQIQADSYGLVLWGHASGWLVDPDTIPSSSSANRRAYGQDTNGDGLGAEKWINITQIARAMESLPKFEFIFADCCNMMCAEIGYELRNCTNYMIGSPAEIPGPGAPYDIILPYFFKNGSELYKGIIDCYYDCYLEAYPQDSETTYLSGYSVPLSVIDTKYIEQLAEQTRNLLPSFMPTYPQRLQLDDVPYYWHTFSSPIFYDMRAIIRKHADNIENWEKAYNLAVPYYRTSEKWMTNGNQITFITGSGKNSGCISMFVPMLYTDYVSGEFVFNVTCTNFGWNRIMDWSRFGW